MLLNALYFWEKQYNRYLELLKKAQFNPLFKSNNNNKENEILKLIMMTHNFPDSFLFSHRHIELRSNKYSKSMNQQLQLLNKKYPFLEKECWNYGYQENTIQLCYKINTIIGIEFTIFPNEHPYITRQKISKVGMTEKGNVYIIHNNGAQTKK